jgi:hypothetical protein
MEVQNDESSLESGQEKMNMEKLENQVLLSANEDYSGLWEVYFEAEDIYRELAQGELIVKAREVILGLLDLGWIQLYWCEEPLAYDKVNLIERIVLEKVLFEEEFWQPPEKDSISIRFFTTPEGEKAFAKRFLKCDLPSVDRIS